MLSLGLILGGLLLAAGVATSAAVKRRRAHVRGLLRASDHEEFFRWARAAGYDADDASNPELAEIGQRVCDLAGELDDSTAFEPPVAVSSPRTLCIIARRAEAGRQQLLLEYTSHLSEPHAIGTLTSSAAAFTAKLDLDASGRLQREGRLPELDLGASFEQILTELGAPSRIRFTAGQLIVTVPGTLSAERGRQLEQLVLDIERRLAAPSTGPER